MPATTGQPAKLAQRANLFHEYSVLGSLSGGSTKPGPLDPDLYSYGLDGAKPESMHTTCHSISRHIRGNRKP